MDDRDVQFTLAPGEVATRQEIQSKQQAVKTWVTSARSQLLPFSFEYNDKSSNETLKTWPRHDEIKKLDADRTEHTIRWNPEALKWLTDHLSQTIAKDGIDVYRQDFNLEPLVFWRASDAPDRQGMTENLYVQGYLKYWNELLRRDPDLLIDTCASGGRRNDIETLRRAVPLWRSDDSFNPVMEQTHTYGLSQWVPYSGTGMIRTDTYAYRSALGSSIVAAWDLRDQKLDHNRLRKITAEFQRVSQYYVEDYYPLTEFSLAPNVWLGWQFNRPEQGDGIVQAFRRAGNNDPTKTLLLRDLDPRATYKEINMDDSAPKQISGRDLMRVGLPVEIPDKDGAALIIYRKVR